jgi:hypothetical protein
MGYFQDKDFRLFRCFCPFWIFLGVVIRSLGFFHAPVTGQQRLGLNDRDDLGQPVFDGHTYADQNPAFRVCQWNALAEFASQDFVLLPQVRIFKGDAGFEQSADTGYELCRLI